MHRNKPRFQQRWAACVLPLFIITVSGCAAIPPALSKVSWLLSSACYVATSKGPSDHLISYAVQQDCSLFRLIKFQPICRPITEKTNQSIFAWIEEKFQQPVTPPDLPPSPKIVSVVSPANINP